MKPPFEKGQRVRYTGSLYKDRPYPLDGTVTEWNPVSRHVSVLWDFYPDWPLPEYREELERI